MCNEISCTPVLIIIMIRSLLLSLAIYEAWQVKFLVAYGVCGFDHFRSQSFGLLAGNQRIGVAASLAHDDNCAILIN
jgi:hypothetical protein